MGVEDRARMAAVGDVLRPWELQSISTLTDGVAPSVVAGRVLSMAQSAASRAGFHHPGG